MFVGHYRSVNSPEEFYSEKRDSLDFPTQIEVNKKRYSLIRTFHIASDSKYNDLVEMAKKNNISYGVKIK